MTRRGRSGLKRVWHELMCVCVVQRVRVARAQGCEWFKECVWVEFKGASSSRVCVAQAQVCAWHELESVCGLRVCGASMWQDRASA